MEVVKAKKKRGGPQPGSGRPKGMKNKATLEREAVQAAMQQQIMGKAKQLINAGLISAMGQTFVYRIDEELSSKGNVIGRKHVLVTDPDEIGIALDAIEEGGKSEEDKYYYVSATGPDHKAVQMLLDRAFGKPKESIEHSNPDGNLKTIIVNKG